MMENTEKIIEKIKKVLELSRNNPSEAEAEAAALKAQKMMADYHISMAEVDACDNLENIIEKSVDVGMGNKWKYELAHVIDKNFRCKHYLLGNSAIVFYGYEVDAEIACETFKYLYDTGNRLANNYYQKLRNSVKRDGGYFDGRGIKNNFLIGFTRGISEELDRQCTALMIITPKEVEEGFQEKTSGFRRSHHRINTASYYASQSKQAGIYAGREAISSRKIAAM